MFDDFPIGSVPYYVKLAKENDPRAVDFLLHKYAACLNKFKSYFILPGMEHSEAGRDILIPFFYAIKNYDLSKVGQADFFTYLYRILSNKASTSTKSINRIKRKGAWQLTNSFDDPLNQYLETYLIDQGSETLFNQINLKVSIKNFNKKEIYVFTLLANDYKVPEIALLMNENKDRVIQIKNNLLKKIKKLAK